MVLMKTYREAIARSLLQGALIVAAVAYYPAFSRASSTLVHLLGLILTVIQYHQKQIRRAT
jgi:hypothetical protein